MQSLTEEGFLEGLRARGAKRLRRVRFRRNRRRIWSLTRDGTTLNLHAGYRRASDELLDHFARIVQDPRGNGPAVAHARSAVRSYPPLLAAVEAVRSEHRRTRGRQPAGGRASNCATPDQQAYLDGLYAALNARAFGDRLPTALPIRLSRRMKSTWGSVRLGREGSTRTVHDLALNLDLMLPQNDRHRTGIMLHEMAHVEAYLTHGERGHGAAWRRIARRVGCRPRATLHVDFHRRRDRRATIDRVPPLPSLS